MLAVQAPEKLESRASAHLQEIERDRVSHLDFRSELDQRSAKNLFELDEELQTIVNTEFQVAIEDPEVKPFLKEMLDGNDVFTWTHTIEMSKMAIAIGYRVGLDTQDLHQVAKGSLLHDIGKIAPEGALMRQAVENPGKPTDIEFQEIRKHPDEGYRRYVESGGDPQSVVAKIIRLHHGCKTESPYPDTAQDVLRNQKELDIVSVVAAADIVHSLASRSYAEGRPELYAQEIYEIFQEEASVSDAIKLQVRRLLDLGEERGVVRPEVLGMDRTARLLGRVVAR